MVSTNLKSILQEFEPKPVVVHDPGFFAKMKKCVFGTPLPDAPPEAEKQPKIWNSKH